MKVFFDTLAVAFAMYSRLPAPRRDWDEKNMRYSLAAFPLVGAFIALMIWLTYLLCHYLALSPVFFGAAALFINIATTGGLHFDGFADVIDALSSHKEREEKLRILKDPHIGAFALIYTVLLLLLQFAAFYELYDRGRLWPLVLLIFIASRTLAAALLITLPQAKKDGLAAAFAGRAAKKNLKIILSVYIFLLSALALYLSFMAGLCLIILAALLIWRVSALINRQFGGITGDLAGYYISIHETLSLFLLAFLGALIG